MMTPNFHLGKRELVLGLFALATAVGTAFVAPTQLVVVVCFAILLLILLELKCRIYWSIRDASAERQEQSELLYRQLEMHSAIIAYLQPRIPLPPMRGWAISPDCARILLTKLVEKKPQCVVELGSGVSSLIIAYALEKCGGGRLISIEHDACYLKQTESLLKWHQLDHLVDVVHAPIDPEGTWYDLSKLSVEPDSIDFLWVDGPPRTVAGDDARKPTVEKLESLLKDGCLIMADDAAREDDRRAIRAWEALGCITLKEVIETEKGTAILHYGTKD